METFTIECSRNRHLGWWIAKAIGDKGMCALASGETRELALARLANNVQRLMMVREQKENMRAMYALRDVA